MYQLWQSTPHSIIQHVVRIPSRRGPTALSRSGCGHRAGSAPVVRHMLRALRPACTSKRSLKEASLKNTSRPVQSTGSSTGLLWCGACGTSSRCTSWCSSKCPATWLGREASAERIFSHAGGTSPIPTWLPVSLPRSPVSASTARPTSHQPS